MVEPIGEDRQQLVRTVTEDYIRRAEVLFGRRFERIPVGFDLKGRAAGMFRMVGRWRQIRFNPWIFAKYFEENLHDTVAHEVAHYVVQEVYGNRVRAHGREWQGLMLHFGANPSATFDLDLEDIPQRRQATHCYRCSCRLHEVSTTRHNRVQYGRGEYLCRFCDGLLIYAPELARG